MIPAFSQSSRLTPFGAICVATLLFAAVGAAATELPIQGDGRGSPFRVTCGKDVLVGFEGRAGGWIDNFKITCASVDASGIPQQRWSGKSTIGDSRGGGAQTSSCPFGEFMTGIYLRETKGDGPTPVIHSMYFYCRNPQTGRTRGEARYGSYEEAVPRKPGAGTTTTPVYCPAGEVAIGVQGRYGTFIDAVGLICGAVPSGVASAPPLVPVPPPPTSTRVINPYIDMPPLTGQWSTQLGSETLQIEFVQNERQLSGRYVTRNGERGGMDGRLGQGRYQFNWQQGALAGTGEFLFLGDGNSFAGALTIRSNSNAPIKEQIVNWRGNRR